MLTYKIFLASSLGLLEDRLAFGDIIQELNDKQAALGRNVKFSLYKCERDTSSFSNQRKQNDYNEHIDTCHVFVMLYAEQVGRYTEEEYDHAYARFKSDAGGFPRVLVFKKLNVAGDDSVKAFEQKIDGRDAQFWGEYDSRETLRNKFDKEIETLFTHGVLKSGIPATTIHSDGQSVPENFMGRREELAVIREKLNEGGKLMLINAEGGIGKTTLAAKYWNDSLYDYKYNAWLFCENGIVSELKKMAPRLNIDLSNMTEKEQLVALKAGLQNASHDMLLVLDNANDEKDIEVFRQEFRGFHWHVLMTSRCKDVLAKEQEYEITTLPPPVAKALFVSNYKEDTPEFDALLDRLLEAIHYNTLLIEIFSKNISIGRTRDMNMQYFLTQLEGEGLYLQQHSFEVPSGWGAHNKHIARASTNQILDALYNFEQLSANEDERYLLVNIALLPAVEYSFSFLMSLFFAGDDEKLHHTLLSLSRKGWLKCDDTGYRLSPVIQELVIKKHDATLQADVKELVRNLNEKLESDGTYLNHFNEAGPFVAVVETITKYLNTQPFEALGKLNDCACIYYQNTGNVTGALQAAERYKLISEQMGEKDGLSIAFSRLGNISLALGDLEHALSFYNESLNLIQHLHDEDPTNAYYTDGLAVSYSKIGDIYQAQGNLSKALRFYDEFLKLEQALHCDYPANVSYIKMLAISYSRLGEIYEAQGNLDEALHFYNEDLKLSQSLHTEHPSNVSYTNGLAISCSKLGEIYEAQGDLDKALHFYNEYLKLKQDLHKDHPASVEHTNGLAVSYSQIGYLMTVKEQPSDAIQYYRQAKEIWDVLATQFPHTVYKRNLAVVNEALEILKAQ